MSISAHWTSVTRLLNRSHTVHLLKRRQWLVMGISVVFFSNSSSFLKIRIFFHLLLYVQVNVKFKINFCHLSLQ